MTYQLPREQQRSLRELQTLDLSPDPRNVTAYAAEDRDTNESSLDGTPTSQLLNVQVSSLVESAVHTFATTPLTSSSSLEAKTEPPDAELAADTPQYSGDRKGLSIEGNDGEDQTDQNGSRASMCSSVGNELDEFSTPTTRASIYEAKTEPHDAEIIRDTPQLPIEGKNLFTNYDEKIDLDCSHASTASFQKETRIENGDLPTDNVTMEDISTIQEFEKFVNDADNEQHELPVDPLAVNLGEAENCANVAEDSSFQNMEKLMKHGDADKTEETTSRGTLEFRSVGRECAAKRDGTSPSDQEELRCSIDGYVRSNKKFDKSGTTNSDGDLYEAPTFDNGKNGLQLSERSSDIAHESGNVHIPQESDYGTSVGTPKVLQVKCDSEIIEVPGGATLPESPSHHCDIASNLANDTMEEGIPNEALHPTSSICNVVNTEKSKNTYEHDCPPSKDTLHDTDVLRKNEALNQGTSELSSVKCRHPPIHHDATPTEEKELIAKYADYGLQPKNKAGESIKSDSDENMSEASKAAHHEEEPQSEDEYYEIDYESSESEESRKSDSDYIVSDNSSGDDDSVQSVPCTRVRAKREGTDVATSVSITVKADKQGSRVGSIVPLPLKGDAPCVKKEGYSIHPKGSLKDDAVLVQKKGNSTPLEGKLKYENVGIKKENLNEEAGWVSNVKHVRGEEQKKQRIQKPRVSLDGKQDLPENSNLTPRRLSLDGKQGLSENSNLTPRALSLDGKQDLVENPKISSKRNGMTPAGNCTKAEPGIDKCKSALTSERTSVTGDLENTSNSKVGLNGHNVGTMELVSSNDEAVNADENVETCQSPRNQNTTQAPGKVATKGMKNKPRKMKTKKPVTDPDSDFVEEPSDTVRELMLVKYAEDENTRIANWNEKERENYVKDLFQDFNQQVFQERLDYNRVTVTWNSKLKANPSKVTHCKPNIIIAFSTQVINTKHKLTIIYLRELCRVAVYAIDRRKPRKNGKLLNHWVNKAANAFPWLTYKDEIFYPHKWKCKNCKIERQKHFGYEVKVHPKCLKCERQFEYVGKYDTQGTFSYLRKLFG